MKYNQLITTSKKSRKRVGRGISAGGGKTAGRGTKGQNSRSGGKVAPGFEGGQNPIYARTPKLRGFKSKRTPSYVLTTRELDKIDGDTVSPTTLIEQGKLKNSHNTFKVIYKGELNRKLKVEAHAASQQAIKAVEKAGGSLTIIEKPTRSPAPKTKQATKEI